MRLTIQLIDQSPQFINAFQMRELDLRGHQIAIIENMGATRDSFDCIDLSENTIQSLSNFPILQHLKYLFLTHNHIASIQEKLHENLPNLTTLNLCDNRITSFDELRNLQHFRKLENLTLKGNPLEKNENYRMMVIRLLPQLKYLDSLKVSEVERKAASESDTFEPGEGTQKAHELTQEQKNEILEMLKKATSMAEINRLEACLRENRMPS